MQTVILFLISILPAIVLLWYFGKQDKGEKEPRKLMWRIFLWGIMSAIFAVIIELNLEDIYFYLGVDPERHFWLYTFLTAFVTAAFVEEAIKLWVVKTHAFKKPAFNEVMDGITYTIIASMGFATFENIMYVMDGGLAIGIIRALISVPAHAMFSGIMGYYIGKAKFLPPGKSGRYILIGFFYGVLYHGLFDFFLFAQNFLIIFVLPLLIIMGMHLRNKIKLAQFSDHVSKVKPAKLTAKKIIKVSIATILIFFGVGSIAGSIILTSDPTSGYTNQDIIISVIFAASLFAISYMLLRKSKPQNSPRKTT